jgi:hypothetical protein
VAVTAAMTVQIMVAATRMKLARAAVIVVGTMAVTAAMTVQIMPTAIGMAMASVAKKAGAVAKKSSAYKNGVELGLAEAPCFSRRAIKRCSTFTSNGELARHSDDRDFYNTHSRAKC